MSKISTLLLIREIEFKPHWTILPLGPDWQMTKFDSKSFGETLGPDISVTAGNVKDGTTCLKAYFTLTHQSGSWESIPQT